MNARWKTLAIGALVPALVTGGIAVAERGDSDRADDRKARHARAVRGHHGAGLGLLRKLTYAELHIREDGQAKVLRVDKGRLRSASQTSIAIEENDGNTVTVAVDENTRVLAPRFGLGRKREVTDIKLGRLVIAVHEGDRPARLVASPPRRRFRRHSGMRHGRLPDAFRRERRHR